MKVKNLNVSSRKTKQKIKSTFAELMYEKKELTNITVTELAKRAEITRASFYTHYDSIYDVAQDIQNETLEVLVKNVKDIKSISDFDNYLDQVFAYLKDNEVMYRLILSSDEPLMFANQLNILINKTISQFFNYSHQKEEYFKLVFYADGCISLVIKYFRNESEYNLDEICMRLKEMFKIIFNNDLV